MIDGQIRNSTIDYYVIDIIVIWICINHLKLMPGIGKNIIFIIPLEINIWI